MSVTIPQPPPAPSPTAPDTRPDERRPDTADAAAASTAAVPRAALPAASTRRPDGFRERPRSERLAVLALLLATLGLYLYGLGANGYANSFYSAAVQAGSVDWTAFFFGASDAGNSITVDKPPASLWVMALSVRLFGLNTWAILVPEVLMGVASVGLLYASVRRTVGHVGGMVAGAVLALTPVAVLMFRFNNPDALLVLLLVAAAWATLRAVEPEPSGDTQPAAGADARPSRRTGRWAMTSTRWFALAGAFIGLAFLTKTLQAFVIVPVLGLVYLLAAPGDLRRRLLGALGGIAAMLLAGGWWVAIVELLPSSLRPYIGGSQTNSFLELTFGYNGLGRLNGDETGSVGGAPGGNGGMWGAAGPLRMFLGTSGGHVSWLLPSALVLLVAGLIATARARRTDQVRAALLVWGGWTVVTTLVFSYMAGIYHDYYTVALAPGIAGVVGVGVGVAWSRRTDRRWAALLAVSLAVAAVWSFILLGRVATVAYGPLRYVVLALGLGAAAALLLSRWAPARLLPVVAAAGLVSALGGPAAYSLSTVATPHTGSIVTAGPAGAGMGGTGPGGRGGFPGGQFAGNGLQQQPGAQGAPPQFGAPGAQFGGQAAQGGPSFGAGGRGGGGLLNAVVPDSAVVQALQADASRYRWVAATVGAQNAAGLQLGSGEPVMPIGGFNGSDPSPTLAQFQQYVRDGQIHYFVGGGMGGRQNGGSNAAGQIAAWVQANYPQVTIGGQVFYDLGSPAGTASATDPGGSTT